jgi:hypothetical protein
MKTTRAVANVQLTVCADTRQVLASMKRQIANALHLVAQRLMFAHK